MTLDRRRLPKHGYLSSDRPVHAGHCVKKPGRGVGCDTTRWHTQVEFSSTVVDEINHDHSFERFVRKVWAQHARAIPRFLGFGLSARTVSKSSSWAHSHSSLVFLTECTLIPSWDAKRPPGPGSNPFCRLYTLVAFDWELTP